MIEFLEVKENKEEYMPLLLIADEQEDMVKKYLYRGRVFVLLDDGVKSICVVTDEGKGELEIKNIASYKNSQKKGYGKKLIKFIENKFKGEFSKIIVGTGKGTNTVNFYKKCGFIESFIVENFFIDNYDHEIIENGVKLVDMQYLEKRI